MTGACVHHIMPHHPHTGGKTRLAAPMMSCKHIRVSRCCTVCMVGAARPPCTTPRMRAASLPVRVQLLQDGRGAVIQPALLQRPGRLDAGPGRQPARACQHLGGYVAVWLGFNLLHWRLDGASDVWRCLNNQIGDAQNGFTTLPCPSAFSCSTCITLCLRLRRSTGWCVFACACAGLLRAQPGSEASCMHYHWFPDSSAHAPAGRRRHRVLLHHAGRLQAGRPQRQHHRRAARALRRHPDRHRAVRPCAAAHFSGPVVPWRSRAAKRPALSDLGFMCKSYLACECCQVGVGANALACWRPHVLAGKSGKSRLPEQHRSPLLANLKHAALALSNNRTLLALAIRFVTVI